MAGDASLTIKSAGPAKVPLADNIAGTQKQNGWCSRELATLPRVAALTCRASSHPTTMILGAAVAMRIPSYSI